MQDVGVVDEEEDENEANVGDGSVDFNYILQLPLWSLTKERIDGLLKQRADKVCLCYGLLECNIIFLACLALVPHFTVINFMLHVVLMVQLLLSPDWWM